MAVFSHPMFDDHEQVVFCHDQTSGLHGIIAIHDTRLGPAVGGCRIWSYHSDDDALTDVLRLSRGMTYKNALAGLPFGGGKAVLLGVKKTPALWQAFANHLNSLGGRYITAEDVGTTVNDISELSRLTPYVTGLAARSGDPSPFTALGVFEGIRACLQHQRANAELDGVRIAVQGAGHVGAALCRLLHQAGAQIWLTDINRQLCQRVAAECRATVVKPEQIYSQDVDVYAPCALGATLSAAHISELKAPIVAGSANNQLAEPGCGQLLDDRGILYAPDYVINAGGIINVSFEQDNRYDPAQATKRVSGIHDTLLHIFDMAERRQQPTASVADTLAKEKLACSSQRRYYPAPLQQPSSVRKLS